MLSEDRIRSFLAVNEDFLHEKGLTEVNRKELKNVFRVLNAECRDLIIRSLFTARNRTLRKIPELELDNKVKSNVEGKGKRNDKTSKAKRRRR
jgi:hypothetical protein